MLPQHRRATSERRCCRLLVRPSNVSRSRRGDRCHAQRVATRRSIDRSPPPAIATRARCASRARGVVSGRAESDVGTHTLAPQRVQAFQHSFIQRECVVRIA
eukprot:4493561-Prymnesium_polylepis.1